MSMGVYTLFYIRTRGFLYAYSTLRVSYDLKKRISRAEIRVFFVGLYKTKGRGRKRQATFDIL